MKASIHSVNILVACLALPVVAEAEVPLGAWDAPSAAALTNGVMPRISNLSAGAISPGLVDLTLETRTLPGVFERSGRKTVMQRIAWDPVKRSHAVGTLAEEDFVFRNPAYRKTAAANAPQNDVWTYFQGRLHGGQIKTHRDGDPSKYLRDMQVDDKAESFLIPDDHYGAVETRLRQQVLQAESKSDPVAAAAARKQYARLQKLGRSYGELDGACLGRAAQALRGARALRAGSGGALFVAAVDGAVVVYRSSQGELTPSETVQALAEAGTKSIATGGAVTAAVLLGANPAGFTVIVLAGVTYVVVDYCLDEVRSQYESTPRTEAEIKELIPRHRLLVEAGRGPHTTL